MEQRFELLAARVLANEASSAEQAEFEHLLSTHPDLRAEFEEISTVSETLSDLKPLMSALCAKPSEISDRRRREFHEALSAKFSEGSTNSAQTLLSTTTIWNVRRFWASAVAALLLACALGLWFFGRELTIPTARKTLAFLVLDQGSASVSGARHEAPTALSLAAEDEVILPLNARATVLTPETTLGFNGPAHLRPADLGASTLPAETPAGQLAKDLRTVLFGASADLANSGLLVTTRASDSFLLYTPLGATASLSPLLSWKAEPGKQYDLTVTDEIAPQASPWHVSGVVPPLEFNSVPSWRQRPLSPNALYRIRVAERGTTSAFTYTFRTIPDAKQHPPENAAAKLLETCAILSGGSGRLGDAFANLLTLPAPFADSELALRLRVLAFAKAGYREDFQAAVDRLRERGL